MLSTEPAPRYLTYNEAQIKSADGGFEAPDGTYVHQPPGRLDFRAYYSITKFEYEEYSQRN